jgi:hypothetical protein
MASSNSFAAYVLNYLAAPASWATQDLYISLHNGDPGTTGANELSNGTYARVASGAFATISTATSVTTNDSVITFATDGNGETVSSVGVWYGASGGTYLFGGALTSSFAYNNGVTPVFAAGALRLRAT